MKRKYCVGVLLRAIPRAANEKNMHVISKGLKRNF